MRYVCLLWMVILMACDTVEIDAFQLGPFRLIALVADQPEVDGTTNNMVSITPWISDVDAQGRNVSVNIVACPDPGIGQGAVPTCDEELATTQQIDYPDIDTSTLSEAPFSGAAPAVTVNIPGGFLDELSAEQQFNGIDYIVSFVFTAGDETVSAFKRVLLSTRDTPNTNPEIDAILADEDEAAQLQDGNVLTYTTVDEPQEYDRFDQNGEIETLTEEFLLTWFVYAGTTSLSRSEIDQEATFEIDPENDNEPFLFGVLRDGRGGLDVLERQ